MAYLEIAAEGGAQSFPLDFPRTVIGENPGDVRAGADESRLALAGGDLSDEHAEVRQTPQGFKVVDLESRHGTRVNGRYVNQQVLADGDEIQLGATTLVFREGSAVPGPLAGLPAEPERKRKPARKAPPARGRASPPARSAKRAPSKPAPTGDRRRRAQRRVADEDEFDEEFEDRAARRGAMAAERKRKQNLTIAMIVIPVVAVGAFLLWQMMSSEGSVNERVRRRMLAQKNALEWSAMLQTAQEAIPNENDHDYRAVVVLLEEAKVHAARAQDLEKLDAANKAWRETQVWRQRDNWDANDEFVARIDAYLAEYGHLGGASVAEARKQRFKITGSSGTGTAQGAAAIWQQFENDLPLVHETGKYGNALRKLDQFWRDHGAANIALRPKKEAMRKELEDGARKYFAKRLYSAKRNHSQGASGKAASILAKVADTIDMPQYREKAAEELDKLNK